MIESLDYTERNSAVPMGLQYVLFSALPDDELPGYFSRVPRDSSGTRFVRRLCSDAYWWPPWRSRRQAKPL